MNYVKRGLNVILTPLLICWMVLERLSKSLIFCIKGLSRITNEFEEEITNIVSSKINDSRTKRTKETARNVIKLTVEGRNSLLGDYSIEKAIFFSTALLQIVSAFTTYSGFKFYFEALNGVIPVLLTLLVQGMLFFLMNMFWCGKKGAAGRFATLSMFLVISIFFSYLGIATKNINMENYIKEQYAAFEKAYIPAWEWATDNTDYSSNSVAALQSEIALAESSCAKMHDVINQWRNEAKSIITTINTNQYEPDGTISTIRQPDLEAQNQKNEINDKVQTVEAYLNNLDNLKNIIAQDGSFSEEVSNVLDKKVNNEKLSDKEKRVKQDYEAWVNLYNNLVKEYFPGNKHLSNIDVFIKGNTILNELEGNLKLKAYVDYKKDNSKIALSEFESYMAEQTNNIYNNFIIQTASIEDSEFDKLKTNLTKQKKNLKWEDLNIVAFKYLFIDNPDKHEAWLYMVLAFANDFGAFLIVLFLGRKRERLDNIKNAADLKTSEASVIANSVLCILNKKQKEFDLHNVLDVLNGFYACFINAPFMTFTGFSMVADEDNISKLNEEYLPLTSTLLKLDYVRMITKEQFEALQIQERDQALPQSNKPEMNGVKDSLYLMRNKFELELQRMIASSACDNKINGGFENNAYDVEKEPVVAL